MARDSENTNQKCGCYGNVSLPLRQRAFNRKRSEKLGRLVSSAVFFSRCFVRFTSFGVAVEPWQQVHSWYFVSFFIIKHFVTRSKSLFPSFYYPFSCLLLSFPKDSLLQISLKNFYCPPLLLFKKHWFCCHRTSSRVLCVTLSSTSLVYDGRYGSEKRDTS